MSEQQERYANRISDRVIDLVNEEKDREDFNPVYLLVGLCLGLVGYSKMALAPVPVPRAVIDLANFAMTCIRKARGTDERGEG